MEHIACALCGRSNEKIVYQSDTMRVVVCVECGLGYMNPRPTQSEMNDFYADDYQNTRHGITTYEEAVERQIRKNSLEPKRERAQQFLPYIETGATVLEIGSGWGAMLRVIKEEKNARVIGLELSDLGREVAEKYYGVQVHGEMLDEWFKRTHTRADVIVMNHVLEHIYQPVDMLRQLKEVLQPNGILYVAVPDIMKPHGTPADYYRIEHAFHFSPRSLRLMLKQAGFKVIDVNTDNIDIRYVCVHEEDERAEIKEQECERRCTSDALVNVNQTYQNTYRRLHAIKKITKKILPKKVFRELQKRGIAALKKLKVISY